MTLLSLVTVGDKRRWSRTATYHLNLLSLLFVGVYAYRDIVPLATFTQSPIDANEGWIIWAKIAVVSIVGVVIPLTIPHQYKPVDLKVKFVKQSSLHKPLLNSMTRFAAGTFRRHKSRANSVVAVFHDLHFPGSNCVLCQPCS